MKYAVLVALATFLSSVNAVAVWGQCGGIGYSGSTTCDAGSVCTYSNDYYSQCIPSSQATTTKAGSSTSKPPSTTAKPTTTGGTSPTTSSGPQPTDTTNPYVGYEVWPIPYYADEVNKAAANVTDATLKAKILKVASVPTFHWLDTISKVPTLTDYLSQISALQKSSGKKYILQIVVYDLPDRDCHANASNGELHIDSNGAALYKSSYIDPIAAAISKYPDVRVVAVVEPDSLANLVTNESDPRCSKADPVYRASVVYAIQTLKQSNIFLYLDAGHAGWLGWSSNIGPAAQLFGSLLKSAGGTFRVRGLATDVANYNALSAASPDPITQGNSNYDEIHYINALSPLLTQNNFPAHFIVDQGRSGVQNIRNEWGDWCNVKGAGFGTRPTTSTGSSLIDAIVWVKPGGESDGTSNTSATRYDSFCGKSDAYQPSPEAGSWNQAYFVMLVQNANPSL